jgi:hypothetical protein
VSGLLYLLDAHTRSIQKTYAQSIAIEIHRPAEPHDVSDLDVHHEVSMAVQRLGTHQRESRLQAVDDWRPRISVLRSGSTARRCDDQSDAHQAETNALRYAHASTLAPVFDQPGGCRG